MKKILAIWFAISLTMYILLGLNLNFSNYIERFKDFPSFLEVFTKLVNSIKNIGFSFSSITNLDTFFRAFGSIFNTLFALIELPFDIIGYIVKVFMIIMPIFTETV